MNKKHKTNMYIFFVIILISILVVLAFIVKYNNFKNIFENKKRTSELKIKEIENYNRKLNVYDMTSLINLVQDYNKDEKTKKEDKIDIEINISDKKKMNMESIIKNNIEEFIYHLKDDSFEPVEIKYNENKKIVKLIYKLTYAGNINQTKGEDI